jgi:catechol-2,3-dioxygenase
MRIDEVVLYTASLARTRLFYHKTLELPLIRESEEAITFRAGNTSLTFKATSEQKPYYHIAFNVTNNKFSDSFEWINSKLDVLYDTNELPVFSYTDWNAQSFYFLDNNGSILEFIARFDLPYDSKDPFSVNDIREISEVGVACDDVTETAAKLNADHGIPYFSRSKRSAQFTVMGDDHGLFILVPKGHKWVPTNKPALSFQLSVIVNGKTIRL